MCVRGCGSSRGARMVYMANASVDGSHEFFYKQEDLRHDKHGRPIKTNNIVDNRDSRHFRSLIQSCFDLHVLSNPKQIDIDSLRFAASESVELFARKDISNFFISQYYTYPDLVKHDVRYPASKRETIRSQDVLTEIMGELADPGRMVVILGEVGEGKSAFLSKLVLDLKSAGSKRKYYPVLVNVQAYNEIIENTKESRVPGDFWERVCNDVLNQIQKDFKIFVPSTHIERREVQKQTGGDLGISVGFIASLRARFSRIVAKITTAEARRSLEFYQRLVEAASILSTKYDMRLVLIFDNLDTFCYEHERFMLFKGGFERLKSKVYVTRDTFWGVMDHFHDCEMSFVFTARHYVYQHVFGVDIHAERPTRVNAVYSLSEVEASLPVKLRLSMLSDLLKKIHNSKHIPRGKRLAVGSQLDKFIHMTEGVSDLSEEPLHKLVSLANQGFRSMLTFYKSLEHHPELFHRYFTYDILYLYLLGLRPLFSQIAPDHRYPQPASRFPNMFLINCKNYYNAAYPEAAIESRLTYWLKYLIMAVVSTKEKEGVTVRDILDMLNSYDDHAVRLCLGSLATANESNCLKLSFPPEVSSLEQMEDSTYVSLTKRGKFLLRDHYCFSLECLQLFFDDWLLPRPKPESLAVGSEGIGLLLKPKVNIDLYAYDYLLNGDGREYETTRRYMISEKAKQALLLLAILRSAQKFEADVYKDSWAKVKDVLKTPGLVFLSDALYGSLQYRIIDDAYAAMTGGGIHRSDQYRLDLRPFRDILNENQAKFDQFFDRLKS